MKKQKSIKRISVSMLFGTYNYNLPPKDQKSDNEKIFILYGDNGSGKTTILKLVYHILSNDRGAGHKTFVARTKFQDFKIEFSDGIIVETCRENGSIIGSFDISIKKGKKTLASYFFLADENNAVNKETTKGWGESYYFFLDKLGEIVEELHFLADDRTINAGYGRMAENTPEMQYQALLKASMIKVFDYISNQAKKGANIGESNVNTLYEQILERLIQAPVKENKNTKADTKIIFDRIVNLEKESKKYSQYGLMPAFKGKEIMSALKSAPSTHFPIIDQVISPYLESIEAKLDALSVTQQTIEIFIKTLRSFMSSKKIQFDISEGIQIFSKKGEPIQPEKLSSGERHLLLLFCNTITLDRQSLFIIDEPEISLNIKWQRKLIDSLVKCVRDNPIQYIFATHSFEILSKHLENVVKLEDQEN
ncbi:MAG: ATP-binding protein [Desulfobacteraceae bacterium]|nr:ATP-binding protein [Desulfobacteraceae bacterium]